MQPFTLIGEGLQGPELATPVRFGVQKRALNP